jgi:hypothetical protein
MTNDLPFPPCNKPFILSNELLVDLYKAFIDLYKSLLLEYPMQFGKFNVCLAEKNM